MVRDSLSPPMSAGVFSSMQNLSQGGGLSL
jgi:hypothetical protein